MDEAVGLKMVHLTKSVHHAMGARSVYHNREYARSETYECMFRLSYGVLMITYPVTWFLGA